MQKMLLFWLLAVVTSASAQTIRISATVLNELQQPQSGNYLFTDTAGAWLAAGYFENGVLVVNVPCSAPIQLQISALHLIDSTFDIPCKTAVELGRLCLRTAPVELRVASVTARKLIFEKTVDGTKVNVENTLLAQSANAAELLGRIPMVSSSGNKVSVFGRGEALLILDGHEISFDQYKSLPPSDIKSIEVITNPDAHYDAKGKAVVLITMQQYFSQGVSVSITNGTTFGIFKNQPFGKHIVNAPNITVNFRKKKWDFNAYYANEWGASRMENQFITTTAELKKNGMYGEDNHSTSVHFYRFGVGYQISENASLSAQYDGLSHYFQLDVAQQGDYYKADSLAAQIAMTNAATTRLLNHSANINYNQKFREKGHTLFVGAQFNQFQNKLLDHITETIGSAGYNRVNDNLNLIRIYSVQADYSHKFLSGNLDFGLKFSHTANNGDIQFFSKPSSQSEFNPHPDVWNKTLYKEFIPAAYVIYKHNWKNVNASVGLRWEHTIANSRSLINKITYFNNSYSHVFPSAKVLYKFKPNWQWSVSYNYKINRPLYQDMDPFLWYLDSLTSIRGNAQLQPELLHQAETRWMFKNFVLRYGFTYSSRTIASVIMQNNNSVSANAVVFTKDNIQHRTLHTIALELPFEKGNYSGYTTLAMNWYQFSDRRPEYRALRSSPQFYGYTYHSYKIPKWFTAEFTAEVYSGSFDGFTKRKPYYYFTLALSRSFLKNDALNIQLMWNDVARTAIWAGTFSANTYSNTYAQRFTSNYVRLTITFNLISKTTFNYNNKNINEAEFNRIKK